MVCAINPSLDLHTDSTELIQLQQVCLQTVLFVLSIYYVLVFFLLLLGLDLNLLLCFKCKCAHLQCAKMLFILKRQA